MIDPVFGLQVMKKDYEVKEIEFSRFWDKSRFKIYPGVDLGIFVNEYIMSVREKSKGFVTFLEVLKDGQFMGNLMAFHDPNYRSYKRYGLGCFGLVTVNDLDSLRELMLYVKKIMRKHEIKRFRGPINMPRFLFGYGMLLEGHEEPIVAGVSFDPPEYVKWFNALCKDGTIYLKTTYCGWKLDDSKKELLLKKWPASMKYELIHPDFENLGNLPKQVAKIFNETMPDRPDGFDLDENQVLAYAKLFAKVPNSKDYLGFYMDGQELIGLIIMQPDWFQVFAGKKVTKAVMDTIALFPEYHGQGLGLAMVKPSVKIIREHATEYFEYLYSDDGKPEATKISRHINVVNKRFGVFESDVNSNHQIGM